MAVYTPHIYLTFGGFLGTSEENPGEIWQCGLRVAANGAEEWAWDPMTPTQANVDSLASQAVGAFTQFMTTSFAVSDMAKMTWVKAAAISATGAYAFPDPALEEFAPVPGNVGAGGSYVPFQVTRVFSLGGNINRGRASRGRIYSPAPGTGVDINNVASFGVALTGFKDLIDDINALDISDGDNGRYARVGIFSGIDGQSQMVTRVGADNRYDTQRRRANNTGGTINWTPVAE